MLRFATIASMAILAASTTAPTAFAQRGGDALYVPLQVGNVVGGGDDMVITHNWTGAGGGMRYEQPGRTATFINGDSGKPSFSYGAASDTNPGREAWLVGGGDEAQVVYAPMR